MDYISSFSGGIVSAVATDRAIQRYGSEVKIWIANTLAEDYDLWRFVKECCQRWGVDPMVSTRGYTPLEVAEQHHVIPGSLLAPCAFDLKIAPFTRYIKDHRKPLTVLLGLNWDEQHRMTAPRQRYQAIDGITVEYPMMWQPYCLNAIREVESWGIEIPRLYWYGFKHNNCGGACVKQGQAEWLRLMRYNYQLFTQYRDWELAMREKLGDYAFMQRTVKGVKQTYPLADLERDSAGIACDEEDLSGCYCTS